MYNRVFDEILLKEIRTKFAFLDYDPTYGKRLFLDNAGGALRLTSSIIEKNFWDLLPDCPLRYHQRAIDLNVLMDKTQNEILSTMLGAKSGSIVTAISASAVFFKVARAIVESTNIKNGNVVTINVEHPSAYDAVKIYAERNNLEFRVVEVNQKTGFIEPEKVAELVDKNTVLVSVIAASNISGNIMDLEKINHLIKEKNKDVYFISDGVQHVPHGAMDVEKEGLDFVNFAPYKFYATRGIGFGYVSKRVANMFHDKLEAKDTDDWTVGTPAPSLYASMLEVIDYACWVGSKFSNSKNRRELYQEGMKKISEQERYLLNFLLEGDDKVKGLRYINGVEIYVDNKDLEKRDLIIAMGIKGLSYTEAVNRYRDMGIIVFDRINTSLYSKRIVESLGLTGAIRVSPVHCHNENEMREFLIATQKIIESLKN
ncbi:aminotransferase class V-fold PLP-dependent enzyme [Fusobacterium sp. 1001295B_180824_G3]|uniref:aminotransferase class V-fold PLP-dependent enzyme n=1 Tax=Fusobacterium sp. 1001295B_180824_G3 TaxID=2787123 RepID=UPI001896E770|nr:aminotransferase class V-fold PLP-dependent enzyme [Fusobacterium sp. 1001295B_180824_G3]